MNIDKIISEEIEKFKLFSKYFPKKTLTENEKLISEQTNNVGADVGEIMRELNNFNSDEQKIVNIVSKYKTAADLKNFLDQYKAISGKDFGYAIPTTLNVNQDKKEFNQLLQHFKSVGFDIKTSYDKRGQTFYTFPGSENQQNTQQSQETVSNLGCIPASLFIKQSDGITSTTINEIRYMNNGRFVSDKGKGYWKCSESQPGILELRYDSDPKAINYQPINATGTSQDAGKNTKTQTTKKTSTTKGGSTSNVSQRFSKSLSNVGIEGKTMDVATLQKLSDLLEKGVSTQSSGEIAVIDGDQPPIAQLNKILDQLNQV